MKSSWKTNFILTLLALIFTISLTFTAIELPRLADSYLHKKVNFPDLATGQNVETENKTQLYLKEYHLQKIGYLALGIILLLIIIGFIMNRRGLASAGAVLLFLPVFGHFAATMFFLGGLAFLRLLWLPFLDISFDIMRLGEIVILPYMGLLDLFSILGISLYKSLPYIITGIGFFIFMLGTLAWFVSKIRKKKVVDFWIYKISRHPQYLGWIIWSYGIMFLPGVNMKRSYFISSTLAWLLSTMVIIGVALLEELKMKETGGDEYIQYQPQTPFLFPIPKFINNLLKSPLKLFFKKNNFERKREILIVLVFFTFLCIILSGFYTGLIPLTKKTANLSPQQIEKITKKIKNADSRITIREELHKLAVSGEQTIQPLLKLLKEENHIIRWYTADVLASFRSEDVTKALIKLLHDREPWVRKAAASSLGQIRSTEAVLPLIEALKDKDRNMVASSTKALGNIGDKRALKPLTYTLLNGSLRESGAAAEALGILGNNDSISSLIHCLGKKENCPYNKIGSALLSLGSGRAIDAFKSGLNAEQWWIRIGSLKGLEMIHSSNAYDIIIDSLKDPNVKVRRAVVWILRNSGYRKAVKPLHYILEDQDFEVRLYVKDAIKILNEIKDR